MKRPHEKNVDFFLGQAIKKVAIWIQILHNNIRYKPVSSMYAPGGFNEPQKVP